MCWIYIFEYSIKFILQCSFHFVETSNKQLLCESLRNTYNESAGNVAPCWTSNFHRIDLICCWSDTSHMQRNIITIFSHIVCANKTNNSVMNCILLENLASLKIYWCGGFWNACTLTWNDFYFFLRVSLCIFFLHLLAATTGKECMKLFMTKCFESKLKCQHIK